MTHQNNYTLEEISKIGRILILTRFPPEYEPQQLAELGGLKDLTRSLISNIIEMKGEFDEENRNHLARAFISSN